MRDINNVAASGIGLSDRESSGHNSSSNLRTNHHAHTETTLSHDRMGTATHPALALFNTCNVDQEVR